MKAIVSTKASIQLQDVPKPIPQDNEVLIKVHATTVTAGDVVLRSLPGLMYWSPVRKLIGMPPRKTTPGHEFAGEVEAVGKAVKQFKVGDAVFGTTTGLTVGANAEYITLPEEGEANVLTHKPSNLTYEEAAAIPVGAMTALQILRRANIQRGQRVMIYGASGSVGTYAVQLARYFSAEVTGVCSTRNVEMVKSLGAANVIDYTQEDVTNINDTYDVIFDAVGKISASKMKKVLAANGDFLTIRTSTHESLDDLIFLTGLIEAGLIRPVIDRCYPLEQTAEAYDYVASKRKKGNIVITVA